MEVLGGNAAGRVPTGIGPPPQPIRPLRRKSRSGKTAELSRTGCSNRNSLWGDRQRPWVAHLPVRIEPICDCIKIKPAGPSRMIRIDGKIKNTSGSIIFTGALRACSSAICRRRTRI